MQIIDHPECYKTGTRVFLLKGRHKDGNHDQRQIPEVTHSPEHFDKMLVRLSGMAKEGERIYVSASERDMQKAIRTFKERQLAADYDGDVEMFYRAIQARWVSALMAPTNQKDKLWLFDCDTPQQLDSVMAELKEHYTRDVSPYAYGTKSGWHVIVQPFNKALLAADVRALIHDNPIMLWGY